VTALARVAQIWVFPVKSMSGTSLDTAQVGAGGLVGDRSWAVVDEAGDPVTAAAAPQLRDVVPHLVDGELRLDVPGAPPGLDVDAAADALSSFLGRPVRLAHRDGAGFVDVAPVHLVSTFSMSDAAHTEDCDSCDIAAPRANLVLDLGPGADPEPEWVGRTVRAGEATLHVVRRPKHCLGVYADVTGDGALRLGDLVVAG
jgi:hypothetical protein